MLVDREEFTAALARVKPALASGGVVAELSHIWFDGKVAQAYDGGFGVKLDFPTELDCGVPGGPLMALLETSVLKEAGLEPEDNKLSLKFGKSTTKLAILEGSRKIWPFPEKLPKKATGIKLDEHFMEALRKTLFIKASPATRVEHYGVMVHRDKKDLALYSTDTSTMASVVVKDAIDGPGFEKTLLPRDFAEQLVAQAPEGADLYVLDDCLIAVADGISFYSNVLDISAADNMGAIVEAKIEEHPAPIPLPAGLEKALERAEILAGRDEPVVTISVDKEALHLFGDYGLGRLDEVLPIEGKHPPAKIRMLAKQLRRALPYAETISLVKTSLLLRGEPGFTYVVAAL